MSFNLIEEGLKMQAESLKNCCCDAYDFPHRPDGGRCNISNQKPEELLPYYLTRQAMIDAGHKESDF
jgi:hypothetical protein